MTDLVQVSMTLESEADAVSMARHVVEHRLAVEAQVVGPIRTFRRWDDSTLEEIHEWQLIMRTTTNALITLEEQLQAPGTDSDLHLLVTKISGNADYLAWINRQLSL